MKSAHRIVGLATILVGLGVSERQAGAQLAAGEPADNFVLENWVTGLNNVTDVAWLSNGRAIVIRKTGQAALVDWDGNLLNPTAATLVVDSTSEKGLLGVVVDDQDNIYFYASVGDTANKHKVLRARAAGNQLIVDLANPLLGEGLEGPRNHDGGGLIIHEGQLYISVGDTGENATPPKNRYGACLNRPNGKILRINLDGSVPDDNPLADVAMATGCTSKTTGDYVLLPPDRRIYAWGLRNPWRFWIDPQTDLLWIGDVGEGAQEEVTVGGKGVHHGWPFEEGTVQYAGLGGLTTCSEMTPSTPCTAPQDSYPHSGSSASVTGGLVPRAGCGWGAYENRYFFGDYNRGNIWTLDLQPDRSGAVPGSRKDFASFGNSSVVSFRSGPDGALYVVSHVQGSVRRVAPKNLDPACQAVATDAGVPPPDAGFDAPVDAGGDAEDAGADATEGQDAADGPVSSEDSGGTGGTGGGQGGSAGNAGSGGSGGSGVGARGGSSNPMPGSGDAGGCSCHVGGRAGGGGSCIWLWISGLVALFRAACSRGRRSRPLWRCGPGSTPARCR